MGRQSSLDKKKPITKWYKSLLPNIINTQTKILIYTHHTHANTNLYTTHTGNAYKCMHTHMQAHTYMQMHIDKHVHTKTNLHAHILKGMCNCTQSHTYLAISAQMTPFLLENNEISYKTGDQNYYQHHHDCYSHSNSNHQIICTIDTWVSWCWNTSRRLEWAWYCRGDS